MTEQLFPQLIQFSWTICAFVFAVQGWIFLQEFKGNRKIKPRHIPLGLAFLCNLSATYFVYRLLDLTLTEALSVSTNLMSDGIKCSRSAYKVSAVLASLLTVVSAITWQVTKNIRNKEKN